MIRRSLAWLAFSLSVVAACGDSGSPSPKPNPDASLQDGGQDASASTACERVPDGSPCGDSGAHLCIDEVCVPSTCGDGIVDESLGEECDDGNLVSGDGCEMSCTFTCHTDEDCSDRNACNGIERCVEGGTGRVCEVGTPIDCREQLENTSPCNTYVCRPEDGICEIADVLIDCHRDEDGDGYPSETDTKPTVDDCLLCPEGYILPRTDRLWDCNDRHPAVNPAQRQFFTRPHCSEGGEGVLVSGEFRCDDDGEPSFDYDCSGHEELRDDSSGAQCAYSCSAVHEAWASSAPPTCGNVEEYVRCPPGTLVIVTGCSAPARTMRTQECR